MVAIVTPSESAALQRLHLLTPNEMVALCDRWLAEDLDQGSADIAWVAAQHSPTESEVGPVFERAILQLVGQWPDIDQAAVTAVRLYVRAIADGAVPEIEGMDALVNDIEHQFFDRPRGLIVSPDRSPEDPTRYAGEVLGLEQLFTWYRELQDAADGDRLFYFNDLPPADQIARFKTELRQAAGRLADQLETDDRKRGRS